MLQQKVKTKLITLEPNESHKPNLKVESIDDHKITSEESKSYHSKYSSL